MLEDRWLTARLGRACFTFESGDSSTALTTAGFHQAKVPCADVRRVRELEDSGFGVIDVRVTLRRVPGNVPAEAGVQVRPARAKDRDTILDIAVHHSDVSRFHMDPEIDPKVAAAIKRDWAAAVLNGERGERMLVAVVGKLTVGFLAVLTRPDARVIDLIAVHADERGAGVGTALVLHLLATSDRPVEVGTQVANVSALRFYERLGFTALSSTYVLHRHIA